MTRLIDADALKEEYVKLGHCAETYEELYTSTEKLIDNAPTVEPEISQGEPVIKCQDCKY